MRIDVKRENENYHFTATNDTGNVIHMDGSPKIGGENKGMRPMQLLLCGLGGCSGIDVISILKKQKQEPTTFEIHIDGEREEGKEPSLWKDIHCEFTFTGELDPPKVIRAVQLSMDKYCSVAKTLESSAGIVYSVVLNGEKIA